MFARALEQLPASIGGLLAMSSLLRVLRNLRSAGAPPFMRSTQPDAFGDAFCAAFGRVRIPARARVRAR
eukprot:10310813-Lingulodinium_polyedra.AAC.1